MGFARGPRALGAIALVALGGCAFGRSDFVQLNPGSAYPPRPKGAPVVLTVGDWDRPYVELGMVHVSGFVRTGHQDLNEKLRTKAREAGADAVVFVRYGTENVLSILAIVVAIPWDVVTAEGLAVRSKRK
jgi:hypothetical protein